MRRKKERKKTWKFKRSVKVFALVTIAALIFGLYGYSFTGGNWAFAYVFGTLGIMFALAICEIKRAISG